MCSTSKSPLTESPLSRREFLVLLAFWSGWISLAISLMESLKEPSLQIREHHVTLGPASAYAIHSVSFFPLYQVWLVREPEGFYALSAVCTHLGCQTQWQESEFQCPCHGSRFNQEGRVLAGPALRALERLHIYRSAQGEIALDLSRSYRAENGDWAQNGAFLPWPAA